MLWRVAAFLSVICCVLYANTLTSDFVFDDHHAVVSGSSTLAWSRSKSVQHCTEFCRSVHKLPSAAVPRAFSWACTFR